MVNSSSYFIPHYKELFRWENLEPGSPNQTTRNRWLWQFGCFAKYNGIWFPCMVVAWSLQEDPLTVSVVVNSGSDVYTAEVLSLLPTHLQVSELEFFYSVFPLGMPVRLYIAEDLPRIATARKVIDDAVERSLETALIISPTRWVSKLKQALNFIRRGEWYVVDGSSIDIEKVKVLDLPNTTERLERLWESYDWATQQMYIKLGFAFNPEKRERMIQAEMIAQTQVIRSNRDMLTQNLIRQAEAQGNEKVLHIVDYFLLAEKLQKVRRYEVSFFDGYDDLINVLPDLELTDTSQTPIQSEGAQSGRESSLT